MPFISPDDGYLTVFNIFDAGSAAAQDTILDEMRDIIDNANYPGWISSTLHAGEERHGTANYIQWRSLADLEDRYAGEKFRTRTVPTFHQIADTVRLLKTELVFSQHHPALDAIEISPERDDYTVIVVLDVSAENEPALLDTLAKPDEWIMTVPGYRSHTYFRSLDGTCVVNYAQWDSREHYEWFHHLPEDQRPAQISDGRARARSLVSARWSNTHRVVHTRSAAGSAARGA